MLVNFSPFGLFQLFQLLFLFFWFEKVKNRLRFMGIPKNFYEGGKTLFGFPRRAKSQEGSNNPHRGSPNPENTPENLIFKSRWQMPLLTPKIPLVYLERPQLRVRAFHATFVTHQFPFRRVLLPPPPWRRPSPFECWRHTRHSQLTLWPSKMFNWS